MFAIELLDDRGLVSSAYKYLGLRRNPTYRSTSPVIRCFFSVGTLFDM